MAEGKNMANGDIVVREATDRDIPAVVAVLAEAFHDDPVLAFVLGEGSASEAPRGPSDRHGALLTAFLANRVLGGRGLDHVLVADGADGRIGAAAIWLAPHGPDDPEPDLAMARAVNELALGEDVLAARIEALMPLFTASPTTPSWYLFLVGTLPSARGRGLASALITEVTDRCDAEGIGAHLESSDPANVPLYERHGFAVIAEVAIEGGPTVPVMWRDPR